MDEDEDQDTLLQDAPAEVEAEAEYDFEGFSVVINERIGLTPVAGAPGRG